MKKRQISLRLMKVLEMEKGLIEIQNGNFG
jgi:hypothetical protein